MELKYPIWLIFQRKEWSRRKRLHLPLSTPFASQEQVGTHAPLKTIIINQNNMKKIR